MPGRKVSYWNVLNELYTYNDNKLVHSWPTFSLKDQKVNTFGLVGHMVSVSMTQVFHHSAKTAKDNTCYNKTLLVKQAAGPQTTVRQPCTIYSVLYLSWVYSLHLRTVPSPQNRERLVLLGVKDGKGLGGQWAVQVTALNTKGLGGRGQAKDRKLAPED